MWNRFRWTVLCIAGVGLSLGAVPEPNRNPTLAPDSGRILFQSDRDGNWEVYSMRVDGSEQINLSHNAADDEQPSLSPDGRRIVFTSKRDGNYEIYVMDNDGSHVRRLTNDRSEDVYP